MSCKNLFPLQGSPGERGPKGFQGDRGEEVLGHLYIISSCHLISLRKLIFVNDVNFVFHRALLVTLDRLERLVLPERRYDASYYTVHKSPQMQA